MIADFFSDKLRSFIFTIDRTIYGLLESAYNLITELAGVSILNQSTINDFAQRIYVLIGLIMLFKVAISLINYYMNPDSFSDSKAGMGSVLKRISISLVLLVVTPTIFSLAFQLQGIVVEKNLLPTIIFGGSTNPENAKETFQNGGKMISTTLFKGFFTAADDRYKSAPTTTYAQVYDGSVYDVSVGQFQHLVTARDENTDEYYFDYSYIISTIAGGLAAWIMMMFCFDVAVRSVKLSFFQLIAPVPILAYIDPKKGDKTFHNWVSSCVSTYLDLFIRLISIYFVMYIISELTLNKGALFNAITGNQQTVSTWAWIFTLFGLLLFAKEAPQLIYDVLGIKPKSTFTLNPMKKLGESPYAAGLVGAVGGAAGAMYANTRNLAHNIKKDGLKKTFFGTDKEGNLNTGFRAGWNAFTTSFSPLAGGFSGGFHGGAAGLTSGGKGSALNAVTKGITDSNRARNLRAKGYGLWDKVKDRETDIAGIKQSTGTTNMLKNKAKILQQQLDNVQLREQQIRNQQAYLSNSEPNVYSPAQYNFASEYLKNSEGNYIPEKDSSGNEYYKFKYATYDDYMVDHGADSGYLDEAQFNMMRQLDRQAQEADREGKKLEKQIKDINEDMGKFKDRNKK